MEDEWIGIAKATKLSGKSGSTIRRWCDARLIKNRKRKDGRRIHKNSLLSYLATNERIPIPPKKNKTSQPEKENYHTNQHKVWLERVADRNERILELKQEITDLKELNKHLQSEVIKNGYELRAILAQQTSTHPSSWTRQTLNKEP